MSESNNLPDSWITVKVSDVGTSITGNTPSTQNEANYGGSIPYIKPPQLIDRQIDSSKEFLSEQGAKLARVLPIFSVLVSCIGNLGKTGLNKIPVAFNQQINAIVPFKGISPTYLFYQAQSHSFRSQLELKATATTISIVNKGNFETVAINIAPFPEQHRIVAKIEELFSELDKGVENLKTARAQLKVYRQALLKHAFEGKLTAQWRAENQDKLETAADLLKRIQQERAQRYQQQLADWEQSKSPSIPLLQRGKTGSLLQGEKAGSLLQAGKTSKSLLGKTGSTATTPTAPPSPTVPSESTVPPFEKGGLGGIYAGADGTSGSTAAIFKPKAPKALPPLTAEELAGLPELPKEWAWVRVGEIADVQLGRQRSPNNRSKNFPTKYIRAGNLTDSGLNLEDVLDMEFEPLERARFLLKRGDVLLSEASGSANQVGKPAVWRGEIEECCFQNTVIRARTLDELSEYLFWVFKTYYISGVFSKLSGGVGINHLSAGKLESMAIPLVAIFESKKILELINEKLSLIENLDQTITTSLQQAEALHQSILKKAFSGQLVAQDASDEPASVLLARIKAEKNAQPAKAKTRQPQKPQTQPAPVKTNVIPFPIKIPTISATDLQAGIVAQAYQLHLDNPKCLPYFGHVKAEKISHMVEACLGIDLERAPYKDAAGPNDYQHLIKVESRARKANWFDVKQQPKGKAHVYSKKSGFDNLLNKTTAALGKRAAEVDALLKLLLPMDTTQTEIVATLFAAWNNLLLLGLSPTDKEIVFEARDNWHEAKLDIDVARFFSALEWMRSNKLIPVGRGRYVDKKKLN